MTLGEVSRCVHHCSYSNTRQHRFSLTSWTAGKNELKADNKTHRLLMETSKILALKCIILAVVCGRGGTVDTLKDLLQQMAAFLSASPTSARIQPKKKKEAGDNKTLFFPEKIKILRLRPV